MQKVPGVGFLTATALLTVAGRPSDFKNGRQFAAYLGLAPLQYTTCGKPRMLGITIRGNSSVRALLIHGSRAALRSVKKGGTPFGKDKLPPGSTNCWSDVATTELASYTPQKNVAAQATRQALRYILPEEDAKREAMRQKGRTCFRNTGQGLR